MSDDRKTPPEDRQLDLIVPTADAGNAVIGLLAGELDFDNAPEPVDLETLQAANTPIKIKLPIQ